MNFEPKTTSSPKSFNSTSSRFRIFDHFPKFSTNSQNSDDLDEEAYHRKFSVRNIDFLPETENPEKNENLHEWLITSYYGYGSLNEPKNAAIFGNLYPNLSEENDLPGHFSDNLEPECSSESNSLLMAEKIELEQQKNADLESNSMGVYNFDYKLCKNCKSRYTRNRSTRWFRIIWLLISTFLLSLALFPWGLFAIFLLALIPSQVRRAVCKRCRNSNVFWF